MRRGNVWYTVSYTYSSYLGSNTFTKDADNYDHAVEIQDKIKRTDSRAKLVEITEHHNCVDFENDSGYDRVRDGDRGN